MIDNRYVVKECPFGQDKTGSFPLNRVLKLSAQKDIGNRLGICA